MVVDFVNICLQISWELPAYIHLGRFKNPTPRRNHPFPSSFHIPWFRSLATNQGLIWVATLCLKLGQFLKFHFARAKIGSIGSWIRTGRPVKAGFIIRSSRFFFIYIIYFLFSFFILFWSTPPEDRGAPFSSYFYHGHRPPINVSYLFFSSSFTVVFSHDETVVETRFCAMWETIIRNWFQLCVVREPCTELQYRLSLISNSSRGCRVKYFLS